MSHFAGRFANMISRPGRGPAADGGPAADNNNSNRPMKRTLYILISLLSVCALAMPPQDDKTAAKRPAPKAQPKLVADDEPIPDSLLHPRWKIKKTAPVVVKTSTRRPSTSRCPTTSGSRWSMMTRSTCIS